MCRPTRNQREYYNGHKRVHALKFQSVTTPDGIIAHLFGPVPGRRHDMFLLRESRIKDLLEEHAVDQDGHFYMYGDSAYTLSPVLLAPYRNAQGVQQIFNSRMSKIRSSVEWGFKEVVSQFAFVDFKKNLRLHRNAVGKIYQVAALMTNCHICLYGSQASKFFDLDPPTLEEYLSVS